MAEKRRLPIGVQDFEKLRKNNYVYIDKTQLVYQLTHSSSNYMFLSRPRRFGKTLLTNTLHAYFEGKKELFEGLAIEKLEQEWTSYPVLHFDMSQGKLKSQERLERQIHSLLEDNEKRLGIIPRDTIDTNTRLKNLIMDTYQKYDCPVVVLIDEYDAPLLDVVHEEENLPILRDVMRNFYSPLKACDAYLRFVFLTGITKFSQLSIFSELNNINNISMDEEYAAICGITEEEMRTQMAPDLEYLAEKKGMSVEEVLNKLKESYDGYHFTWPSPDIYNPYSLLLAFDKERFASFWFESGTPTYLVEMLRKYHVIPQGIGGRWAASSAFDAPTERMVNVTPLLYQSGYITIKDYDELADLYFLDIPNKEVRIGLMENLLEGYVGRERDEAVTTAAFLSRAIIQDKMDDALTLLRTFLSTVPYCDHTDYEGHYQQMLYVIFSLLGKFVDVEVHTPTGRVDVVIRTATKLYLVELKLDKSADEAMRQIDLKEYPKRFALCGLPIVKVGINFDRERRTLGDWKIT